MVELSTYGSGEGAGWVTGRRYSTNNSGTTRNNIIMLHVSHSRFNV